MSSRSHWFKFKTVRTEKGPELLLEQRRSDGIICGKTVRSNLSQWLRLLPSCEWPHPLASRAESERRRDADPISDEGREQTCVKALISRIQPVSLNAPSNRVCWGEGWLRSKANTPTGVHVEADVCRTPGLASTAQPRSLFIFPVQSSGSSPPVSAGPSNALLIATLRLPSPQTHIRLHVPATKSTSAASRRGGGQAYGWRGGGILLKPHFAVG